MRRAAPWLAALLLLLAGGPAARAEGPLPEVLPAAEAARLRPAFAEGAPELAVLPGHPLAGHLLALRWLRPGDGPAPTAAELRAWLAAHADHPDAPAILRRLGPQGGGGGGPASPALARAVREHARAGRVEAALGAIAAAGDLGPAQAARLRAEVAQALFQAGRDEAAWRVAATAADALPGTEAGPAFTAGLAAISLGRWAAAQERFAEAARAMEAGPAQRAAAAFWASRAAGQAGRAEQALAWMAEAALDARGFHGLVARRVLRIGAGFAWERDPGPEAEAALVAATPAGRRALALLQVGQPGRAEAELRAVRARWPGNPLLGRGLHAIAVRGGLTGLAAELAPEARGGAWQQRDLARYPVPAMIPLQGYRADPALLYAMALQESGFDPWAVSRAGARGLLQLMPGTASAMAGDPGLGEAAGAWRLHDPSTSLELAQRYLAVLTRQPALGGDLMRVLAAYNAGPGGVGRWLPAAQHRSDPFLFLEAIPVEETRGYVRRVLAYSWIYASRFGLPAPSLDTLAAGRFPLLIGAEALAALAAQQARAGR